MVLYKFCIIIIIIIIIIIVVVVVNNSWLPSHHLNVARLW